MERKITTSGAALRSLAIETLESRLNLSTLAGMALPGAPEGMPLSRIVGTHSVARTPPAAVGRVTGASVNSVIALGNDGWVTPNQYSAIANCKLEHRRYGQDIGWTSKSGSYVEYTVSVPAAGTYTLNVGVACADDASFGVSSNGNTLATYNLSSTGGWDNIRYVTKSVTLTAGTQTLRFTTLNKSQYNLNSFELKLDKAASIPVPAAPVTSSTASIDPVFVNISQRSMGSFTELDITGISSNVSMYVMQSGNTITVVSGTQTQQMSGDFGTMVVSAGTGTLAITVDSSVTLPTTVYAGTGNDTIINATQEQAVIVTLNGGSDTVTGNGINTAYWVSSRDTVNAAAAEVANGGVHTVNAVYQPVSLAGSGTITAIRDGTNIADPSSATGTTTRLASTGFFGTGPVMDDINQGQVSDCYFLATLQSLTQSQPAKLEQLGVDLNDGTYLVAFQRNGQSQYVRVDGDLPSGGPYASGLEYAHPGASGDQWVPLFEKAYAYFRYGSSSYSSLNWGLSQNVYSDFGINSTLTGMPSSQTAFYNTVSSSLAANKGVDIGTNGVIVGGAPLIQSHAYSVVSVSQDSGGTVWVTLRNPWGFDGAGMDSNTSDALVTLNYATLKANASQLTLVV